MKFRPCPDTKPHGRHEWYRDNAIREDCLGVPDTEPAPRDAVDDEEFAAFDEVLRTARAGDSDV